MPKIKRIAHIAVLVDDLDRSLAFWNGALGLEFTHIEEVPVEKSSVAFLPVGESEIELVRPTTDDSGLARYLDKRGPGLHHVCLEVEDLTGMLAHLKSKGIGLVNETPLTGLDGRKYAFVHPKSAMGVLVELYEIPEVFE